VTAIGLWLPRRIGLSAQGVGAFMNQTLDLVRAVPGVQAAGFSAAMPIDAFGDSDELFIEGRALPAAGNEGQARRSTVSPDYFKTVGIPLLHGRDFAASDDSASTGVAVVDETLAGRYWKGAEALGKRVWTGGDTNKLTIIGVVGAIRDQDVTLPPAPHLYRSLPQAGAIRISLAVHTNRTPGPIIDAAKRAIAEVEPSLPLDEVRSFSSIIDQSFATRRLTKLLLGGFALVGIILAVVGIYGVMSLHVATRAREFGIRLAVGAEPGAVVRHVLGEGAVLAGLGVAFGIGGATVLTRWIASLLYQVSPTDPVVLIALPVLLAAVALAACYIPGRRASKSDPLAVLRAD
jgi:putative ABC transport system permease protein